MKKLYGLISFIAITNIATAQQLLSWNTVGNAGTETTEPSVANNVNIQAANLTLGGGVTPAANANRFGGNNWPTNGSGYIQFTVTPNPGFKFTATSFTFIWDRSGTGPDGVILRSSIDGFTSALGSVTGMVSGGAATTTTRTINISGITDQTSPVTFRLFGTGSSSASGTGGFDCNTGNSVPNVNLIGTTSAIVLPVVLTAFDGLKADKQAILSFTTASERNNSHFEVERSADGRNFVAIGKVKGAGTTTDNNRYSFTDENPIKGVNYYRLKQVDFNGSFEYSNIVSLKFGTERALTVIPTLTYNQISVSLNEADDQEGSWQIFDLSGRQVLSGIIGEDQNGFQADLSNIEEGTYIVRVQVGQETLTEKVQKLR